MTRRDPATATVLTAWLHGLAMLIVGAAALGGVGATIAAALGHLPFLTLPLQFGETVFVDAGPIVQTSVAGLLLAVSAALPSGFRTLSLERSHRHFAVTMNDVAQAYRVCHAEDRAGTFTLSSEFDAVKERISFLRRHPDLGSLEPDVMEAAAQMSHASRELAEIYSDENVSRARGFLRHRQEEIALFHDRMETALAHGYELRRHREMIEVEEAVMESRMARLEEEFGEMIREMGFTRRRANVVPIPPRVTAAE